MNIGNILKVADAIEQASVPGLGFNMSEGVCSVSETGMPDLSGHSCGTVACIAGWATTLHLNTIPKFEEDGIGHWANIRTTARTFLGLPEPVADALFGPEDANGDIDESITPEQAARCLRNLAITGKVDWEAAMKGDEPVLPPLPASKALTRA